jgi:hypothetical protein
MGLPSIVTVPPAIQGDQFVPVVYNVPLTAQIATSAAVNLITVPATGTYRVTVCASQTVLGVGSPGATTFTPTVVWTDPLGAATSSAALAAFATAATNGALGYLAGATPWTITFRAKVGTAISMSVAVTGGGGTTNPYVQVTPTVECLGT